MLCLERPGHVSDQAFMLFIRAQKTNYVDIIFNGHPDCTPRRLVQRADINVKPGFGKKGGQQFGIMIMVF
jgi:hypothetical protein